MMRTASFTLPISAFVALLLGLLVTNPAKSEQSPTAYSLDAIDFMIGDWRSGSSDFVFEESWLAPGGGVMTGMARGYSGTKLGVLEYIIIAEEDDDLIMRFKHFNADFTTWEHNGPIELKLTTLGTNDATFTATTPENKVRSIRYVLNDRQTLKADIVTMEDGQEQAFSIIFSKVK